MSSQRWWKHPCLPTRKKSLTLTEHLATKTQCDFIKLFFGMEFLVMNYANEWNLNKECWRTAGNTWHAPNLVGDEANSVPPKNDSLFHVSYQTRIRPPSDIGCISHATVQIKTEMLLASILRLLIRRSFMWCTRFKLICKSIFSWFNSLPLLPFAIFGLNVNNIDFVSGSLSFQYIHRHHQYIFHLLHRITQNNIQFVAGCLFILGELVFSSVVACVSSRIAIICIYKCCQTHVIRLLFDIAMRKSFQWECYDFVYFYYTCTREYLCFVFVCWNKSAWTGKESRRIGYCFASFCKRDEVVRGGTHLFP